MNLPNQLTLSRLVMTVFFVATLLIPFPGHATVALILFIAASLTDYWDGTLARRHGLITPFGILMDPLADKILVCSAFIAFVELDRMPAWMVIVIVARELAITGLRLLASSQNIVLAAERFGKHKTISQIVCISAILTSLAYPSWGTTISGLFQIPQDQPWIDVFTVASQWLAVLLTVASGTVYLWRNRSIYLRDI